MFKSLIRGFLAGALAGLVYNFTATMIMQFMPLLPFGLSNAVVLGILVMVFDYILENVVRF